MLEKECEVAQWNRNARHLRWSLWIGVGGWEIDKCWMGSLRHRVGLEGSYPLYRLTVMFCSVCNECCEPRLEIDKPAEVCMGGLR